VKVLPLHLPGREDRITEPLSLSPADLAEAIAARADRPFAIYGHSLGARLGFEVIRALMRLGGPLPMRFFAAAARPPDVTDTMARCVLLPDDGFLATLIERLGAPAQLRDIPELRYLLLPVLRADFWWINQYRYHADVPLPVPVVALAGAADPEAGPTEMAGWLRHTSAGFRLHTLGGGHFFLRDAAPQLCSLLSADLRAALGDPATTAPTVPPPASDEVHAWLALLDDLPDACTAWAELSPDQAMRAARLHDDTARRRFVGECAVLRWVLRRYGASERAGRAATVREADRPDRACHPDRLHVAVSQSGGVMLVGVSGSGELILHVGTAPHAVLDSAQLGEPGSTEGGALAWTGPRSSCMRLHLGGAVCSVAAPGTWRLRLETVTATSVAGVV